jgi:type IV secretory pathway protease TraF
LAIVFVGAAAIALLLVPTAVGSARLVWNSSASAPAGIYWIDHGPWAIGDRVAVQPSENLADDLAERGILPKGRLLIKRVVAGQRMTVCRVLERIILDGTLIAMAKTETSSGQQLPDWQGCYRLGAEDVFLMGDTANSYDGRYFGITDEADIVGVVRLVLPFPAF